MRGAPPSLGELLQRAGLVDGPTLEVLVASLRERLRGGNPTSLGRLLIERGLASTRILAVATSGERSSAIRCDACTTVQAVPSPPPSREFPCARCGAYLLPLGPATDGKGGSTIIDDSVMPLPQLPKALLPNPAPNEDTTMPLGSTSPFGFRSTSRFEEVLAIPGAPDPHGGTTHAFNKVLPIPASGVGPLVPIAMPGGTEDPTVSLPALAPPPPALSTSGIGIPPTINARPAFPQPYAPAYGAPAGGIPPIVNAGVPPVIQDARVASSGLRRQSQPAPPGIETESPTVADPEGSGGAFGAAAPAPAAGTRSTTVEQKSPLGSREGPRANPERRSSGRQERKRGGSSNFRIIFLAFAATMFVAGMGFLAFVVFKQHVR